jgi:Domain of unknown function (DUF1707)
VVPVPIGPEDPAATGHDRLRAGHAEREGVIDALKNAFVHGRLTKDEFDGRASRALAVRTRFDLAALIADIPPGPAPAGATRPPPPTRRRPLVRAAAMSGLIIAAAALWVVGLAAQGGPGPSPSAQASGMAKATGTATRAPVGSRSMALELARRMLSRLVVPAGSQAAYPSPVPQPLNVSSSATDTPWHTVDLRRFVLVREPVASVRSFLLAHVPARMRWAGDGLGQGTSNTVTVQWVAYSPRSLPSGLVGAELGTAAMPLADGDTLIRADASVTWFPPRSAAEQLNATSFRSVTVAVSETFPRSRTVTRTFTSPAVVGWLVALLDSLPATPDPDVAALSCLGGGPVYRLGFTPGVVVYPGGCGASAEVTVNGKQQPALWDPGMLTAAVRQLLHLTA